MPRFCYQSECDLLESETAFPCYALFVDSTARQPHSADYFTDDRDYWWDPKFLALAADRWGLGAARTVLDVGSGLGHWGRALLPHVHPDASLTGIDRESQWVRRASEIAGAKGIGGRAAYQRGDALSLPFEDDQFDLVTCQTVLIHVTDCRAAIREMIRVARPGGLVLAAEPNNLASSQVVGSARFDEPVAQRLAMARFQLLCERGKANLGEGNNSIGELVPGYFSELALIDVDVWISNIPGAIVPPYSSAAQQALAATMLDRAGREFWIWNITDTRRYFEAGGGDSEEFDGLWALACLLARQEVDALRRGTYSCAGGGPLYLVKGRKAVGQ